MSFTSLGSRLLLLGRPTEPAHLFTLTFGSAPWVRSVLQPGFEGVVGGSFRSSKRRFSICSASCRRAMIISLPRGRRMEGSIRGSLRVASLWLVISLLLLFSHGKYSIHPCFLGQSFQLRVATGIFVFDSIGSGFVREPGVELLLDSCWWIRSNLWTFSLTDSWRIRIREVRGMNAIWLIRGLRRDLWSPAHVCALDPLLTKPLQESFFTLFGALLVLFHETWSILSWNNPSKWWAAGPGRFNCFGNRGIWMIGFYM